MAAVMVILSIRPQTFLDLLQEPAIPPTLFCPMESAVIPLLIDAQRPKHGHHWPTVQVGVDEAVLPAGVYGLRRLAKKTSASWRISTSSRACWSSGHRCVISARPRRPLPPQTAPFPGAAMSTLILSRSCSSDFFRQLQRLPVSLLRVSFSHFESLLV